MGFWIGMNYICIFHDWKYSPCMCRDCGKTRVKKHKWDGCKCSQCNTIRNEQHDWDGCKCIRCGRVRDKQHKWDGCKCSQCNTIRNEQHNWGSLQCKRCGQGVPCPICGRTMSIINVIDEREGKITVGYCDTCKKTSRP